jgi:ribosomal-protein-alanine N-acetyltransferase
MKTNPATKLRSKRVFLREPEVNDRDALIDLYRSSRHHFRGFANADFTRERFDLMLRDARLETNAHFLICRTDDRSIVGSVNLSQIFRKLFQNAYIGYQLFAGHTGQGYMTEAVSLALRHAFHEIKLHRIEASVQPGNKTSIAVLERNGFTKEGFSRRYLKINGRWRDHERWAILKEDWRAMKTNGR